MPDHNNLNINLLHSLPGGPAPFDRGLLQSFVPLKRSVEAMAADSGITYQAYMDVVQRFVFRNWGLLDEIVRASGFDKEIDRLDLIAEKHGRDYHPARIRIGAQGSSYSFVVIVAVNQWSQSVLEKEFRLLQHLREKFRSNFIPKVYLLGDEALSPQDKANSNVRMMLGEWFDGFHEFHLCTDIGKGSQTLLLWDMDRGYVHLSQGESEQIYRAAAFILTSFYDTETFEEIFPWHHASGDFVASLRNGQIDLRLTTARQYAPRSEFNEQSSENRVMAMILFLANLTIRMRLDRFEGVGETVWAEDYSVNATIKGFADALKRKIVDRVCDLELANRFARTLQELPLGQLAQIFQRVVESYDRAAPDLPVIQSNLAAHVWEVYKSIETIFGRLK
ncbi:MAG TPA: hypothetical protein VMC85_22810 [Desulfomonilaceae bacterium]|nr:hypothetical protein [Desulfomonilaceae bacterium]